MAGLEPEIDGVPDVGSLRGCENAVVRCRSDRSILGKNGASVASVPSVIRQLQALIPRTTLLSREGRARALRSTTHSAPRAHSDSVDISR
jgi:hypothetical protein